MTLNNKSPFSLKHVILSLDFEPKPQLSNQFKPVFDPTGVSSVSSASSASSKSMRSFNFDSLSNFQTVNLINKSQLTRTTVTRALWGSRRGLMGGIEVVVRAVGS